MATRLLLHFAALLVVSFLALDASGAPPVLDAVTSWTSVEGVTIQARLAGWDGTNVILDMEGRFYKVPMIRLSGPSVERARLLLGMKPVAGAGTTNPAAAVPAIPAPAKAAMTPGVGLAGGANPSPMAPGKSEETGLENPTAAGMASTLAEELAPAASGHAQLFGRRAVAPAGVPGVILAAIEAGNRLQYKTYKWGGGRGHLEDTGYDCSGCVSYVLIKAGLLEAPLDSRGFARFGAPGPGRWITIHASPGHVFMTICGLRLDTSGHGQRGPRWRTCGCRSVGSVIRHPPGL